MSKVEDFLDCETDDFNWGIHHVDSGTCALDIDHLPSAREEFQKFGLNLDNYLNRDLRIVSGIKGRAKLLYRMPVFCDMLPSKQLKFTDWMGTSKASLNFRSANASCTNTVQDVLPPSIHPETLEPYSWANGDPSSLREIPQEILNIWLAHLDAPTPQAPVVTPQTAATIRKRLFDALAYINPDIDRGRWVEVGMAIHSVLGDEGYSTFLDWSAQGQKFQGESDVGAVWRSIHEDQRGITVRTLYKYAKQGGWRPVAGWDELTAAWEKEEAEKGHRRDSTSITHQEKEGELTTRLLGDLRSRGPLSDADPDHRAHVQEILLRAEQLRNPGNQLAVHNAIKTEMRWAQTVLNRHLRFVKEQSNSVIQGSAPNFKHLTTDGVPRDHSSNLSALCDFKSITIRHNRMRHEIEIADPARPHWLEDEASNLQRAHIEDLCVEYAMPYTRANSHINTIGCEHSYHPMEEYLKQQQWDGLDWFTLVADTVETTDRDLWRLTLGKWALSVCAAVRELTKHRPPRGVLVMQGKQLTGKTSWFRYLTPDSSMFGEGVSLDPSKKDSIKIATKYAIVELGELDSTFNSADLARLKAFISSPYDEVRLPYAKTESKWPRRTVFCGTVNNADFLADRTGNTRFWTNEVRSINLDIMEQLHKSGDIGKFWAQVNTWLNQGESWWLTKEQAQRIEKSNEDFMAGNMFEELLEAAYEWPHERTNCNELADPQRFKFHAVNPMSIGDVALSLGFDPVRILNTRNFKDLKDALRRLTGQPDSIRTRQRPYDPITKKRGSKRVGRWYYMPYPRIAAPVARVINPTFSVVKSGTG